MTRILMHATHYPHPEHVDALLDAMRQLNASAADVPGLGEIGAFTDPERERILAISVWASVEAMQAGMVQIFGSIGSLPFDIWERQPRELLMLTEANC